ncbi:MAG TPA: hypothetical protein VGE76_10715 [Opitutaceae bacterium]
MAVSLVGAVAFAKGAPAISFASLPKGDSLVVTYTGAGCFDCGAQTELIYTNRSSESFVVYQLDLAPKAKSREGMQRTRLGEVALKEGEAAKLDAFLAHCRNPSKQDQDIVFPFSPGLPAFTITHLRGKKVMAEERLGYPARELPADRLLDFAELISAAYSARAKG